MIEKNVISLAYQEARTQNKNVLYMCARGTARSLLTAQFARKRGETHSNSFTGGYNSLYNQAQKDKARTDHQILDLTQENVIRIFEDNVREFVWLKQTLCRLLAQGQIEKESFEFITLEDVKRELAPAVQLVSFFESFNYLYLND